MSTTLVALCAAAAVWMLLTPSPAAIRLDRLVPPQTARPFNSIKARVEALRARRTLPHRRRMSVIELCDAMAAELAAGRTPDEAFAAAATVLDPDVSKELVDLPHPPFDHLAELANRPGAGGLRLLAACWRVGAERGGALATVLDGLATALRDDESQRQDVAVQLAAPRATARLLAVLPLLGVAMAAALGAHPLSFLCGTLPGLACLVTGTALNLTGLYWTRHLAKSAEFPH
ncbi:type II secretion system F family protein [Actinomadura decatromicini]|uniref:Type II secretion system protein n=1 Tax=Actinomadura decatromicini TaxID=2604572 RepID=A0A5D3FR19_9ACTN|nr:type II secretion system F family protein [Actinomadura decatromicini]TYK50781.1 type II secretion system protein [Actinomadura decatromicini]